MNNTVTEQQNFKVLFSGTHSRYKVIELQSRVKSANGKRGVGLKVFWFQWSKLLRSKGMLILKCGCFFKNLFSFPKAFCMRKL